MKLIINLFGPSTAGKSTIAELLEKHIDQLYTVDFDVIKRQISGYHWKRDSGTARQITLDTLASVSKTDLTILALLPPPKFKELFDRTEDIAKASSYTLINIEITAPEEVLVRRYQDRLRQVEESGTKWKFKTLDEFKARLQEGYYRPDNTVTFDSSVMSPDLIFNKILELITKL
jgi:adenylate kinase family enzyme